MAIPARRKAFRETWIRSVMWAKTVYQIATSASIIGFGEVVPNSRNWCHFIGKGSRSYSGGAFLLRATQPLPLSVRAAHKPRGEEFTESARRDGNIPSFHGSVLLLRLMASSSVCLGLWMVSRWNTMRRCP